MQVGVLDKQQVLLMRIKIVVCAIGKFVDRANFLLIEQIFFLGGGSRLALSLDKIGCASELEIEQALSNSLCLHYLCRNFFDYDRRRYI